MPGSPGYIVLINGVYFAKMGRCRACLPLCYAGKHMLSPSPVPLYGEGVGGTFISLMEHLFSPLESRV